MVQIGPSIEDLLARKWQVMNLQLAYLVNSKDGLQGEDGIIYNYIFALNGVFLHCHNELLDATIKISEAQIRGLAYLGTQGGVEEREHTQFLSGHGPLSGFRQSRPGGLSGCWPGKMLPSEDFLINGGTGVGQILL